MKSCIIFNLSNFAPPVWKLHNPYCHTVNYVAYLSVVDYSACVTTLTPRTNICLDDFWFRYRVYIMIIKIYYKKVARLIAESNLAMKCCFTWNKNNNYINARLMLYHSYFLKCSSTVSHQDLFGKVNVDHQKLQFDDFFHIIKLE